MRLYSLPDVFYRDNAVSVFTRCNSLLRVSENEHVLREPQGGTVRRQTDEQMRESLCKMKGKNNNK